MIIDEPYISAATYTGAQCAYSEVFGIDTDTTIGGGEQEFTFRRSSRVSGGRTSSKQGGVMQHRMTATHSLQAPTCSCCLLEAGSQSGCCWEACGHDPMTC